MKVGILSSGDVGRRLGDGLIELGHTVTIETQNPKKMMIANGLVIKMQMKEKLWRGLLQNLLYLERPLL